jgi:hypothetical protein
MSQSHLPPMQPTLGSLTSELKRAWQRWELVAGNPEAHPHALRKVTTAVRRSAAQLEMTLLEENRNSE